MELSCDRIDARHGFECMGMLLQNLRRQDNGILRRRKGQHAVMRIERRRQAPQLISDSRHEIFATHLQ